MGGQITLQKQATITLSPALSERELCRVQLMRLAKPVRFSSPIYPLEGWERVNSRKTQTDPLG
jgi:hypothetical protein